MAGNQTLLVEVDWSSKSGSADSTIAFNETFDISLNGVNDFGADSNVRLVLSTAQTGLEKDNILYVVSKSPALANGSLRINNIRIATQEALDTLNQQGGKGNFYLFVMEERADGSLVDFGSCRIKMTLGGYTEDTVLPENIEGLPTIKELQDSIAAINGSLAKAEAAAKRAETAVDDLSEDIEDFRQTASDAKKVSEEAKTESAEAKVTADKAESIAKGAQYAKVFATEAEMKTWAAAELLKAEDQREVKVGDNLYIEELEVPDYWWTGEGDGYAQLETGAVKVDVDDALDANSANPVQNKKVKEALDGKFAKSGDDHLPAGKYGWSLGGTQGGVVVGGWGTRASSINLNNYTVLEYDRIDVNRGGTHEYFALTGDTKNKIVRKKDLGTLENCVYCVGSLASSLDTTVTNLCSRVYCLECSSGSGSGCSSIDMADSPDVSDIFCNDFRDNPNGYAAVYDKKEYKGIGAGFINGEPVIRWNTGCSIYTYPLGGGGGSSNDSICVYDSEGYCAAGIGTDYVAIGDKAIAYTESVAVGAIAYAQQGEVAIGFSAGQNARVNGFISDNAFINTRRFRACTSLTANPFGNELFFATKDGKAVLGGEFGLTTNDAGNAVPSLCYFYLQDVADMLANGGGGGSDTSVMVYDDGFTIGTHTADGGLTTGISYNNKNAQRNPNTLETWKDGEQVSREQIATLDTLAEYAMPIVTTVDFGEVVYSYAYIGSRYQGQPVVGVSFDTVNRDVENGGKISIQFFEKATGSEYGEIKEETFVPSLENFNALAERVAALEAQLTATTQVVSEPDDELI